MLRDEAMELARRHAEQAERTGLGFPSRTLNATLAVYYITLAGTLCSHHGGSGGGCFGTGPDGRQITFCCTCGARRENGKWVAA